MIHEWYYECFTDPSTKVFTKPLEKNPGLLTNRLAELEKEGWEVVSISFGRYNVEANIICRRERKFR